MGNGAYSPVSAAPDTLAGAPPYAYGEESPRSLPVTPLPKRPPRIAIVHEWLVTYAGSEKVLSAVLDEFPDADVFCQVDSSKGRYAEKFHHKTFRTGVAQRLHALFRSHRLMLPIMMLAVEQFDVSGYDIVISNSHSVAKGVITGPGQLHLSYCYSPMRYAWDLQHQYLREADLRGAGWLARYALHRARIWDSRTADSVDEFVACSHYIAERIWKTYRRTARVIYPGVDTAFYTPATDKKNYYITSSRMVPYKKVPLIVEAFARMPDKRLVVIGDGPQYRQAVKAAGRNVEFLGYVGDEALRHHLQAAKAFIFAAEEDFGIAPLEAQACGTPVLAYGRGGASETVLDGRTGLHFWEQSVAAIEDVVTQFEARTQPFDPIVLRSHAERFSIEQFKSQFSAMVEQQWDAHEKRRNRGRGTI